MKRIFIAILSACIAGVALGQNVNPPTPPNPPNPPQPPQDRQDKAPKVPVTWLGVETSPIPPVLCEQMNLPKGFGLVVDYVVPSGPAAAAGVQPNDILKMLNDQILMEPDQLSKLIRSFSEGTTVTLTVMRKGKEEKIPVKLGKKEVPQRRGMMHGGFDFGDHNFGDVNDSIHDAVMAAQAEARRASEEAAERGREAAQRGREAAQRGREIAQRAREAAQRVSERAREEAQRAAGQISITRTINDAVQHTKIDIGKAQIVFSDDKGELRIENIDGKKVLTAKDPQGRLLFSGPVETKEDLDKVPADVRQRYEKLQTRDLPSVVRSEDEDDQDADDEDGDDDDDDDADDGDSYEQASYCPSVPPQTIQHSIWAYRTIVI
jgi:hypothetical protein